MLTTRRIVWDMETLQIVECNWKEYHGSAEKLCGATGQQKEAQAEEASVAQNMNAAFQQIFPGNTQILGNLTASLQPIVAAGPAQFGMSAAETAAERTRASNQITAAGSAASNAARSALASQGGGNTYLPSGADATINAELAEQAGVQEANAQLGITEKGYDIGRQNWEKATQQLAATPGELESPIISAGTASENAAEGAEKGATDIANTDQAWMGALGGIIGSVVPHIPGMKG